VWCAPLWSRRESIFTFTQRALKSIPPRDLLYRLLRTCGASYHIPSRFRISILHPLAFPAHLLTFAAHILLQSVPPNVQEILPSAIQEQALKSGILSPDGRAEDCCMIDESLVQLPDLPNCSTAVAMGIVCSGLEEQRRELCSSVGNGQRLLPLEKMECQ